MKYCLLIIVFMLNLSAVVKADELKNDTYAIFQSPKSVKLTFRLNTHTGEVDQMQLNKNKRIVWTKIEVENMVKLEKETIPRFTLYLSPLSAKETILLDKVTGTTWQLRKDSKGHQFFLDFGY